jgi:hypothetical protein
MLIRTAVFSLMILAIGCAGQTRTFDIAVHNNSTKPLTLVLAKDGGPKEPVWATPEDVIAAGTSSDGQWGFGVVPAGKTASNSSVVGKFTPAANAYLRIYVGDLNLGDALKIAPGSPERLDITLKPGKNDFVVIDHDAGIELEGAEAATQPTTEPTTGPTTEPATAPTSGPAEAATEPAK